MCAAMAPHRAEVSIRGYNQPGARGFLFWSMAARSISMIMAATSWLSLPVQIGEIRQIEVVKGPNSALYGFNAVGGVVNIITYDPVLDSANMVTLHGGTQDRAGISGVVTLHDGDTAGLRLSGGGSRTDEFSTASLPPALGPYHQSPSQFAFNADSHLNLADKHTAYGGGQRDRGAQVDVLPSPTFTDDTYRTNSLKFGLVADTQSGDAGCHGLRNQLNFIARSPGQIFLANNTVNVLQAADLFKAGALSHISFWPGVSGQCSVRREFWRQNRIQSVRRERDVELADQPGPDIHQRGSP